MEEEEENDMNYNIQYVEDFEESDEEGEELPVEEAAESAAQIYERMMANRAIRLKRKAEEAGGNVFGKSTKNGQRNARVEIEYEDDLEERGDGSKNRPHSAWQCCCLPQCGCYVTLNVLYDFKLDLEM